MADELILASGSPRRRELLARFGLPFRVVAAEIDETGRPGESPEEMARRLSQGKARAVASTVEQGVVIGADTIVVLDGAVMGKPADAAEARQMLQVLRGRAHTVLTAITVVRAPAGEEITNCAETTVLMRDYTDEEIEAYVASGDPLDKAGAYAIQHAGFHPVERIEGSYSNVVGLPTDTLYRLLQRIGLADLREPSETEP